MSKAILTVTLLCLASCVTTKQVVQEVPKTVAPRIGCAAMGMVSCIRFDECRMINEGTKGLCIEKIVNSCKYGKIPEEFDHPLDASKLNTCLQDLGRLPCEDLIHVFNGRIGPPEECNTM